MSKGCLQTRLALCEDCWQRFRKSRRQNELQPGNDLAIRDPGVIPGIQKPALPADSGCSATRTPQAALRPGCSSTHLALCNLRTCHLERFSARCAGRSSAARLSPARLQAFCPARYLQELRLREFHMQAGRMILVPAACPFRRSHCGLTASVVCWTSSCR